jgi:hypothetical protein
MTTAETKQGQVAGTASAWALPGGGTLDAGFPGGNLIVERSDADRVYLRQDLRDTEGWWFWWCFRVRGAAGRRLTFQFTDKDVIGTRGPAVCTDGGLSWSWLGQQPDRSQFTHTLPAHADEVRYAFSIPYVASDLQRFLTRHAGSAHLRLEELCRTAKGRSAERLLAGRLDGQAPCCLLLTARHHACESIANFELEGLLDGVLADSATGAWFRENVEVLAVPFVDKDGVEDGDQGKNRRPRDHNRDYSDPSMHVTVQAIRASVPTWSRGRPLVALDLHCPHLCGAYNEQAYFVGQADPRQWQETTRLAALLESHRSAPVPYAVSDNLPFGTAWNTEGNYGAGRSFARWAQTLPGLRFGGTLEFPYANVKDWTVHPDGVRAFGGDLARALWRYLEAAR